MNRQEKKRRKKEGTRGLVVPAKTFEPQGSCSRRRSVTKQTIGQLVERSANEYLGPVSEHVSGNRNHKQQKPGEKRGIVREPIPIFTTKMTDQGAIMASN